ncbi:pleckstrin homology domain-containing family G member 1 [Anabrus simplex]|uniref:pleckstrin homology domain-containing family G member 1 n=1 Tax=Anabrus simplex TaxID=316456 RepID=UPI0035A3208C
MGSRNSKTADAAGTSTDLVPTLLGMYDTLIGRSSQAADLGTAAPSPKRTLDMPAVSRPLSISSIASSSSSSSSGASSCSGSGGGGRRLGAATKSSAYLASIESLEDDSDEEQNSRTKQGNKCSGGSQGSGDSGVCSPCSYISSPCPPPGRPRYCDPHLSYMDRVVMEVVETEGVYVRDLQEIIEGYLDRWRSSSDCPLSEKQLGDLFSNIEEIYKFNSGFLQELEQCGLDPVQVARCFVRKNAGFSIYTQYCTNYPRTVSVLTELMRQEAAVRLFRERQTALQHTLPLGSYLLKPVQRILKYHLLLQNIVKHYVYEAEGYNDIVDALSTMTGIAHHINNMKRRHEHAVRVQEIQSLLYGWEGEDLTTFGELCAEGAFRMYGAKAMRHAFLFDKMLLITKKKEEGILGYKTHIMCSNLMLIESVPGEPLSFHVIPFDNPRLQYTLQARNLEQKREWTMQLKRVILENYNAVIPSHARQLVMELGQNRTDDEIMADKNTPKRQHSAPEYLEKRKQERERRKSETGLRHRLKRTYKSDVGLSGESPSSHRRGRRASSSSRDRSQSRDGLRSASPAKIKERFGSWRRKSEPGCYSSGNNSKADTPPKLTVAPPEPETPSVDGDDRSLGDELEVSLASKGDEEDEEDERLLDDSMDSECGEKDMPSEDADPTSVSEPNHGEDVMEAAGGESETEAKTLEEIVSQLLMQNHEFQKILKKQQRHVNLRHRFASPGATVANTSKDETTDDEDGVYETLTINSTNGFKHTAGQSYRAHRHAHMRALRNEQKSAAVNSTVNKLKRNSLSASHHDDSGDADYVTLLYHKDANNRVSSVNIAVPSVSNQGNKSVDSLRTADPLRRGSLPATTCLTVKCEANTSTAWKERNQYGIVGKVKSVTEGKEDSSSNKSVGSGNYDNLQQIWESVRRQQEEIHRLAESEEVGERAAPTLPPPRNLRRTQSFSCRDGLDERRDTVSSVAPAMSEVSLDTLSSPTLPAVWLKQQGEHLATPSKKSGSLPRSFQLSHESQIKHGHPHRLMHGVNKSSFRTRLLSRDGRTCSDRPFTIASDKPAEINFDDIERYIEQSGACHIRHRFPISGDTTEEECMTDYTATPNASLNELNVHPEYKIYRPTVSKASLKHVISSVSSKLAGMRVSSETLESNDLEVEHEHILQRERRASRLVYALARQYSKTLKQRIKNIMGEDSEDSYEPSHRTPSPIPCTPNAPLPIYKQGSSSLGARIAHCSDYANPRILFPDIHQKPSSETRPDSVLSVSSNFTSSSEGEKTSGFGGSVETTIISVDRPTELSDIPQTSTVEKSEDHHLSDGSADSYYERSFEAMESFLENDMFRDSAVFSDHEDVSESSCNGFTSTADSKIPPPTQNNSVVANTPRKSAKVPPPVPAKPDILKCKLVQTSVLGNSNSSKVSIVEKLKTLEESSKYQKEEQHLVRGLEGISKSIRDRRRELELWKSGGSSSREDECDTSSQHSAASTVIEVSPGSRESPADCCSPSDESATQRGWVKHVIGKLQGGPNDD